MKDFIAIDFETGNPKRVSACSLGYAKVWWGRGPWVRGREVGEGSGRRNSLK